MTGQVALFYIKNNFKINFLKNTLLFHISIKFFQIKKIEFCGYFTYGLVLQRKIKAWSRNNHSCHKWRLMQVDLCRPLHTNVQVVR